MSDFNESDFRYEVLGKMLFALTGERDQLSMICGQKINVAMQVGGDASEAFIDKLITLRDKEMVIYAEEILRLQDRMSDIRKRSVYGR